MNSDKDKNKTDDLMIRCFRQISVLIRVYLCSSVVKKTLYFYSKLRCELFNFLNFFDVRRQNVFRVAVCAARNAIRSLQFTIFQSIVAITFSSIAIGVGSLLISTVVRQGRLSLKYSA